MPHPVQPQDQPSQAWRILFLLFLANLLNFFDRAIPAVIIEPIRLEWGLSDLQIGALGTGFTIVYAVAGIPVGRLGDVVARRKVIAAGLLVWSGLTALNGMAWSFWSFLLIRMGVGVGEASYAPAANSLIGDLFPSEKRARAMGVFMLGLPLGLLLAFFTLGAMTQAFGSWRAPFFVAALPGIALALFTFFMREPRRGSAEQVPVPAGAVRQPLRKILAIRTLWWLTLAGLTYNFAAYAANSFLVPMLQRYFGLPLQQAAVAVGIMVGLTGLLGLTGGGWLADKAHQRWARGRLLLGTASMLVAALCTGYVLLAGKMAVVWFVTLFSIGWLFAYSFYTCAYTAIQDVVEPRLRATATALFFAGIYLLGGGLGPLVVGGLSDHFAESARLAAGAAAMTESFRAIGLHGALVMIPLALLLTMLALWQASRTFCEDARRMQAGLHE